MTYRSWFVIEQENVEIFCLTELNVEKLRTVLSSNVKTRLLLTIKTISSLPKIRLFTHL